LLGSRVERLDIKEHVVELEKGKKVTWDKLLLASGGVPIVPQIEGIGLGGVFTFNKLDDARAIDAFLKPAAKAVVIGGGLIGVSATEALVKRGVGVTIVELKERILNTILDEEASALVAKTLEKAGVDIITEHTVAEISGGSTEDGVVSGVTLDDGRRIDCDLVIIAIGVQPRTELVSGTRIKTNRGIVVDRHMATSNPDVYACGDVAEAYDFVYGENRLTPIWPNAYIGGRTAGLNMAGLKTDYPGGTAMNSLNYFGLGIVSAGIVAPVDDGYEVLSQKHDNSYHKVVLKDGLVVGMVFAGNIEKSGIVFGLMKDRVRVDAFREELVAADFGLVSLPEEIRRTKLEAPPSELVAAVTPQEPEEIVMGE
jgi:NAD(P)H-nitrite reductase large subunit